MKAPTLREVNKALRRVKWVSCATSNNLYAFTYLGKWRVLLIEFQGPPGQRRPIYAYAEVPASVVRALKAAPSRGQFCYRRIYPQFFGDKVYPVNEPYVHMDLDSLLQLSIQYVKSLKES